MAVHEIRVSPIGHDAIGNEIRQEAERVFSGAGFDAVRTAKVYRVAGVSEDEANALAKELFTDPISEEYKLNEPIDFDTPDVVEVGYRPGIMNPEAASIMKAASDLGIHPDAADSSREYAFFGVVERDHINNVVGRLLLNKTVQQVVTEATAPVISEVSVGQIDIIPIRFASEKELQELSQDKLFLDAKEMDVIQRYFRKLERDPTDAELEIIAGRWSEHCGHKTFKAKVLVDGVEKPPFFDRIKEAAKANFKDLVVSAFDDNSGVMRFYDGDAICGKVETHNSPAAIDPYGGAMTGSGGVFRDIMGTGQGAKTIISTDMFCFAPTNVDPSTLPTDTIRPDHLQRRAIQGVRDYGNRVGIPTANGSIHYDEDFRATPTVIVGAYGILPESLAQMGEPEIGDLVVTIGGRTGRDGIHGATFSSGEMTNRTVDVNGSAVQIGNAIEEKRIFDALLETRDLGYIRALTDCGAAGFSSAIGEMSENIGVTVDISKAPVKYAGLSPWEVWLSESQERMVAAISPSNIDNFILVCDKYNVDVTVLGEFDGTNTLTLNYGEQNVATLDYEFLDGLPQRIMQAKWERSHVEEIPPETPSNNEEWLSCLKAVLSHGNICSKEPIVRQYDHGVQGGNVVSPYGGVKQEGPNDALVIRPVLSKPYGIVLSHGMNPSLMRLDPYEGTIWAITEAAANYVAVGGNIDEATAVGNYIWPFPDEEAMGSLDLSVDAAVHMMHVLELPVISGKDSLSSTYRSEGGDVIKIPPVYTMSIFGRIPDVEKTMTSEFKHAGESWLYLIGQPNSNMGGSTYYNTAGGIGGEVPTVDTDTLPRVLRSIHRAIQQGAILACHDVSEGGIAVSVAEMCFGSTTGANISIPANENPENFLFSEAAGCFIVEVDDPSTVTTVFDGIPYYRIGKTSNDEDFVILDSKGGVVCRTTVDELKAAWQAPMKELFG